MYVILLGPPGVGKGTQGALLAEKMDWQRLATGDLLRAAKAAGSPLGHEAQTYMAAGELVPDRVIIDMVQEKLSSLPAGTGVIFDGFPRNTEQASAFSMMLQALGLSIDRVIVLEADEEMLTKRIAGRRSCPQCGSVYNTELDPPQREGVCDRDGNALIHREDDTAETVVHRLSVYHEATEPLIAYYEASKSPVHHVRSDQAVDVVQGEVRAALGLGV